MERHLGCIKVFGPPAIYATEVWYRDEQYPAWAKQLDMSLYYTLSIIKVLNKSPRNNNIEFLAIVRNKTFGEKIVFDYIFRIKSVPCEHTSISHRS
jgi:hypothetical protein